MCVWESVCVCVCVCVCVGVCASVYTIPQAIHNVLGLRKVDLVESGADLVLHILRTETNLLMSTNALRKHLSLVTEPEQQQW